MFKVTRFRSRSDELSPVVAGYINPGDGKLCWAGRDWQNTVVKPCGRMIIESGRKVIGVHIQLSAQIKVGIGIGSVLVALDMTECGWQIVIAMEQVNHFCEVKFSCQRCVRIWKSIGLVILLPSNQF